MKLGFAKLAVQLRDGTKVTDAAASSADDHDQQFVVIHVKTDTGRLSVIMQRGDFARLCAYPNSKEQCEAALLTKEDDDRPEPE